MRPGPQISHQAMTPQLHWIDWKWPGRLAISARPRGGDWLDDEVMGWRAAGIDTAVSLLTPPEVAELGLEREPDLCQRNSLQFLSFPIMDRGVPPSFAEAVQLIQRLEATLRAGRNVAVHCRQGIGRSGIIAAGLLVDAGLAPDEALLRVSRARGLTVPDTPEQRDWVARLGSATVLGS